MKKKLKLPGSNGAKGKNFKIKPESGKWQSVFECGYCKYIPDRKELGRTEQMDDFEGMETIFTDSGHPDRYMDTKALVLKCKNCGTYYFHYHSIDTEDAFVGGPRITHEIQRINLLRMKDLLVYMQKPDESNAFDERYENLVFELNNALQDNPASVIPNFWSYVIESITDYYIIKNDWEGLKTNLLKHSVPNVVFDAARDLIYMYAETARNGPYPPYTDYKTISSDRQLVFKPFFEKHMSEFKILLENYSENQNPVVQQKYQRVMNSLKYYKL
ncbi:MAG: hypothetical protein U0W24_05210 [Bacteroidales bacterium]